MLHPQLLSLCRMRRDRDPPRESAPSHRLRLCRLRTRWPTFYGIKDAQRAILRGSTCANTSTNYSVNRCEKAQDLRNIPVVFILHELMNGIIPILIHAIIMRINQIALDMVHRLHLNLAHLHLSCIRSHIRIMPPINAFLCHIYSQ